MPNPSSSVVANNTPPPDTATLFIAGPTASGKSSLALALAKRLGAEIVNADAQQTYRGVRILTARPDAAAMEQVRHHLYGIVSPRASMSAGLWRERAHATLEAIHARGRRAIVVGGGGMYMESLALGIAPTPKIPDALAQEIEARAVEQGWPRLHAELAQHDPELAQAIHPNEGQRIARGLAVFLATGRSLTAFRRAETRTLRFPARRIVLAPERETSRKSCEIRFDAMLQAGGLEEARDLAELGLARSAPVMKMLGLPALLDYLAGRMGFSEARARALAQTQRYARRQMGWLRNRPLPMPTLTQTESALAQAEAFSRASEVA